MVATWNVAASSAYYARASEYYLGAKEPDGVWYGDRPTSRSALANDAGQE